MHWNYMRIIKHAVFPLMLLAPDLAFADVDCRAVAHDLRNQDQLVKRQARDFKARYGDINPPNDQISVAERRDFVGRLGVLINTTQKDIEDLRWLIDHHCGPAKEEPEAFESLREMEAGVQQMKKVLDKFINREAH